MTEKLVRKDNRKVGKEGRKKSCLGRMTEKLVRKDNRKVGKEGRKKSW
jgi:hypothetical protein